MKFTITAIVIAVIFLGGAYFYSRRPVSTQGSADGSNVTVVNGEQIIEIRAKGGYLPRKSVAKADLPTVIRFNTNGTYDCSVSVRIPSLNISKFLASSGQTDVPIGSPKAGVLKGTCGMGMYPFEIDFRS